ncbi:uncharacterized protein SPSK_05651 [Sporothrix schenckii 1099-18]|uniref:Uncharacterized protein n=1 Tax=Sporothrix schenckii 1099-18 TaxID=1397361 RepID=A0A0F2LW51_SPOSC|nr:uncharacterized protein SPSK_05651 [Sporothrix schenckii 1099-18]KJR80725.1 hypothetical protein SPSK_05651 [Sporothrix schenckii 1099-18]
MAGGVRVGSETSARISPFAVLGEAKLLEAVEPRSGRVWRDPEAGIGSGMEEKGSQKRGLVKRAAGATGYHTANLGLLQGPPQLANRVTAIVFNSTLWDTREHGTEGAAQGAAHEGQTRSQDFAAD